MGEETDEKTLTREYWWIMAGEFETEIFGLWSSLKRKKLK